MVGDHIKKERKLTIQSIGPSCTLPSLGNEARDYGVILSSERTLLQLHVRVEFCAKATVSPLVKLGDQFCEVVACESSAVQGGYEVRLLCRPPLKPAGRNVGLVDVMVEIEGMKDKTGVCYFDAQRELRFSFGKHMREALTALSLICIVLLVNEIWVLNGDAWRILAVLLIFIGIPIFYALYASREMIDSIEFRITYGSWIIYPAATRLSRNRQGQICMRFLSDNGGWFSDSMIFLPGKDIVRASFDGMDCQVVPTPADKTEQTYKERQVKRQERQNASLDDKKQRRHQLLRMTPHMEDAKAMRQDAIKRLNEDIKDLEEKANEDIGIVCARQEFEEKACAFEMLLPQKTPAKIGMPRDPIDIDGYELVRLEFEHASGLSLTYWMYREPMLLQCWGQQPMKKARSEIKLINAKVLLTFLSVIFALTYAVDMAHRKYYIDVSSKSGFLLFSLFLLVMSFAVVPLLSLCLIICNSRTYLDWLMGRTPRARFVHPWKVPATVDKHVGVLDVRGVDKRERAQFAGVKVGDQFVGARQNGSVIDSYGGDQIMLELPCCHAPERYFTVELVYGDYVVLRLAEISRPSIWEFVRLSLSSGRLKDAVMWLGISAAWRGHTSQVHSVTMLTSYIVTGSMDGSMKLWGPHGNLHWNCRAHQFCTDYGTSGVLSLAAIRPCSCEDNTLGYLASVDGWRVFLWKVTTALTKCLDQGDPSVCLLGQSFDECSYDVAMCNHDGHVFVAATGRIRIKLWILQDDALRLQRTVDTTEGEYLGMLEIGNGVVVVSSDDCVRLWDFDAQPQGVIEQSGVDCFRMFPLENGHSGIVTCCGRMADNYMYVWDLGRKSLICKQIYTCSAVGTDEDPGVACLHVATVQGDVLLMAGSRNNSATVFKASFSQSQQVTFYPLHSMYSTGDVTNVFATAGTSSDSDALEFVWLAASGHAASLWRTNNDLHAHDIKAPLLEKQPKALPSPDTKLTSAEMRQILVPLSTLVVTFMQLQAFPLSSSFPWHRSTHQLSVVFHLTIIDFELLEIHVDHFRVFQIKFVCIATLLGICLVMLYSKMFALITTRLKNLKSKRMKYMTFHRSWILRCLFLGGEQLSEAEKDDMQKQLDRLIDTYALANFLKKEIMLEWVSDLAKATKKEQMNILSSKGSPGALEYTIYSRLIQIASLLMLMLSTLFTLPIYKTLLGALVCSNRGGKLLLERGYHSTPRHDVECFSWEYMPWLITAVVLLVGWIPPMFGLVAAHGHIKTLLDDGANPWAFFYPRAWRNVSNKSSDRMPMGLVTRGKHVYESDLLQVVCRVILCVCTAVLDSVEKGEAWTRSLAASYVFVASLQLVIIAKFRPYCHKTMHGLAAGLYLSSWWTCVMGFWVCCINNDEVLYPVVVLFLGWVAAFFITGRMVARGKHEDNRMAGYVDPREEQPLGIDSFNVDASNAERMAVLVNVRDRLDRIGSFLQNIETRISALEAI